MRAHPLDGAHEVRQPFERVVLALHRDQHAPCCSERVDGEQAERRRAIDENEVVVAHDALERDLETRLARLQFDQLDLRAGELAVGGHQVVATALRARAYGCQLGEPEQNVVDGANDSALVHAASHRRVTLRIEIDQEHAPTSLSKRGGEVDAGRRLADAALLIHDRKYVRQAWFPTRQSTRWRSASSKGTRNGSA